MRAPGLDPAVREDRMGIEGACPQNSDFPTGRQQLPPGMPMGPFEAVDHEPLPHCLQPGSDSV